MKDFFLQTCCSCIHDLFSRLCVLSLPVLLLSVCASCFLLLGPVSEFEVREYEKDYYTSPPNSPHRLGHGGAPLRRMQVGGDGFISYNRDPYGESRAFIFGANSVYIAQDSLTVQWVIGQAWTHTAITKNHTAMTKIRMVIISLPIHILRILCQAHNGGRRQARRIYYAALANKTAHKTSTIPQIPCRQNSNLLECQTILPIYMNRKTKRER